MVEAVQREDLGNTHNDIQEAYKNLNDRSQLLLCGCGEKDRSALAMTRGPILKIYDFSGDGRPPGQTDSLAG